MILAKNAPFFVSFDVEAKYLKACMTLRDVSSPVCMSQIELKIEMGSCCYVISLELKLDDQS